MRWLSDPRLVSTMCASPLDTDSSLPRPLQTAARHAMYLGRENQDRHGGMYFTRLSVGAPEVRPHACSRRGWNVSAVKEIGSARKQQENRNLFLIAIHHTFVRGGYRISPRGGRPVMDWCLNTFEWYILNGAPPSQGLAPTSAPTPWVRAYLSCL